MVIKLGHSHATEAVINFMCAWQVTSALLQFALKG
jgi:hypothetical protein